MARRSRSMNRCLNEMLQDRRAPVIARTAVVRRTRPRAGFVLYGVGERDGADVRYASFVAGPEPTSIR